MKFYLRIQQLFGSALLRGMSKRELQYRYNRAVQRRTIVKVDLRAAERDGRDTNLFERELALAEAEVERYRRPRRWWWPW